MSHRIAIDIGGTFTDLVSVDETTGELLLSKDSTTPADFAKGVMTTIAKSGVDLATVHHFVHGSTVIINAITERKGSPTALLTTKGFRDILEITRANRPDMYSYKYCKPKPFVRRRHRFEVDERIDHTGRVIRPLNEEDVRRAARRCRDVGISSVAVCFLHSYANPEHERRAELIIREVQPKASVTLSHTLTREWREYERGNTAVLNAYVQPIASRYLDSLERALIEKGLRTAEHVMQSNGGVTNFANAKRSPIQLVESGPVGGVIGAAILGRTLSHPDVISLDVGGTTAKTSLVKGGEVKINTDYRIEATPYSAGYPVKIPVVDVVEISAGGGSIAWIDRGGALRVGPVSAGADPGPACYGKGGTAPTLTDANVLTGRINPEYFLGGEIRLKVDRARRAMETPAAELGLAPREAALGIIRLANSGMANALRMVSIRRGHDPRDFVMVAMGGAGGLHAAFLAAQLGIGQVLIPKAPAHFSAWGMLMTDIRHDHIMTRVLELTHSNLEELSSMFEQTEEEARKQLSAEGVEQGRMTFTRFADMRYEGQEHTVKVSVPSGGLGEEERRIIKDRFGELHESQYTFRLEDPVEVVNIHLVALGYVRKPELRSWEGGGKDLRAAIKGARDVDFDDFGVRTSVVYERSRLPTHTLAKGPAIVEEPTSTTVVYPGQEFEVDGYGNLVIRTEGEA